MEVGLYRGSLHKGIADSQERGNDRRMSSPSVVEIHVKALVNRVVESTDMEKSEEQRDFGKDRSCIDQVNIVRRICERIKKKMCHA